MELHLDNEQASELAQLLDETLGQLSTEIAATDNPGYRAQLKARRERFRELRGLLQPRPASGQRR